MRMLSFVCWLRGFHANIFKATHMIGDQIYGDASGPCRICGRWPLEGKTNRAFLVCVWPYNPERVRE